MVWCGKFHNVMMVISTLFSIVSGLLSVKGQPDLSMLTWAGMFLIIGFAVPYLEIRRVYYHG